MYSLRVLEASTRWRFQKSCFIWCFSLQFAVSTFLVCLLTAFSLYICARTHVHTHTCTHAHIWFLPIYPNLFSKDTGRNASRPPPILTSSSNTVIFWSNGSQDFNLWIQREAFTYKCEILCTDQRNVAQACSHCELASVIYKWTWINKQLNREGILDLFESEEDLHGWLRVVCVQRKTSILYDSLWVFLSILEIQLLFLGTVTLIPKQGRDWMAIYSSAVPFSVWTGTWHWEDTRKLKLAFICLECSEFKERMGES